MPALARGLAGHAQHPLGVGAREVAALVDHLRFDPDAGAHPEPRDPRGEGPQPRRELLRVDGVVAEAARVVVATGEPAVVDHEEFDAELRGLLREAQLPLLVVVEVGRLPRVVDDRAVDAAVALGRDVRVHEPVHPVRQPVETRVAEGEHRLGGLERLARRERPAEPLRLDAGQHSHRAVGVALDARRVATAVDEVESEHPAGILGRVVGEQQDAGVVPVAARARRAAGGEDPGAHGAVVGVRLVDPAAVERADREAAVGEVEVEARQLREFGRAVARVAEASSPRDDVDLGEHRVEERELEPRPVVGERHLERVHAVAVARLGRRERRMRHPADPDAMAAVGEIGVGAVRGEHLDRRESVVALPDARVLEGDHVEAVRGVVGGVGDARPVLQLALHPQRVGVLQRE